jgi:tRNA 2-selenouridine synthase
MSSAMPAPMSTNTKPHNASSTTHCDIDSALDQLPQFDAVIDVRSPGEFAEDHIPGAINCPVLDDQQRIQVGTLYKQVSVFEAQKLGAALVARNIAQHLESRFAQHPRSWKPLIYCWRGGKRSGAMGHILRQVGWQAQTLEGGYRAYRKTMLLRLAALVDALQFRVVCGVTGSAKSRLLEQLSAAGAQVLDLEALACHRGSLLGELPGAPQPSQKMFDSLVWDALRRFDAARPVYVEAESKKIGNLQVHEQLMARMRAGVCIRIDAPLPARVEFLVAEYRHFLSQPAVLKEKLSHLKALHGHERIAKWHTLIDAGNWTELVSQLLAQHYDPAYLRSSSVNYPGLAQAQVLSLNTLATDSLQRAAGALMQGGAG